MLVVLEGCGYRVVMATGGREAISMARAEHPDLILMDLHMPDIDGFAVLRELRGDAKFARVPIIALTASAMPEDRNDVMTAGFDGFITKPIRLPALRSEVERLLQSGYETAGAGS